MNYVVLTRNGRQEVASIARLLAQESDHAEFELTVRTCKTKTKCIGSIFTD